MNMKRIVMDIDGTLTTECICLAQVAGDEACALIDSDPNYKYRYAEPNPNVIGHLKRDHDQEFEVVLYTVRNMHSYDNSLGKITAKTLPVFTERPERHGIPYGNPWCGSHGFYVNDKATRPDEFTSMSFEEITRLAENASEQEAL